MVSHVLLDFHMPPAYRTYHDAVDRALREFCVSPGPPMLPIALVCAYLVTLASK